MSMRVAPLTGRWLDFASNDQPASWYHAVKASGVVGVVLDVMSAGWTAAYHNALAAGLAIMLFQGYYAPDWVIMADAAQRADYAVSQAESVGYPKGAILWLDWEAVPAAVTPADAVTWINRWTQMVQSRGYVAGLYVGVPQPLSSQALYLQLILAHYWRSCSGDTAAVYRRGYQMVQTACNQMVVGVTVDLDTVGPDALGGLPPAAVPVAASPSSDPTVSLADELAALTTRVGQLEAQVAAVQSAVSALKSALSAAGKALSGS